MEALRVLIAPTTPVMIFDGDCRFCRAWIERWGQTTRDQVEYLAFQDSSVARRFAEIPRHHLAERVHLVHTTGEVFTGAGAVLRALAIGRGSSVLLNAYEHVPGIALAAESIYRLVARHREAAWWLTRLLWGDNVRRSEYHLTRWLFLRVLGLIYLAAFLSLWTQIDGLVGTNGILPVARWTEHVRSRMDGYWFWYPSLIWFNASDGFVHSLCAIGVSGAILVTLNVAPAPSLLAAWIAYQSLYVAGQVFLGYQWDLLLLEVGFAAIFFAPWCLWPRTRWFDTYLKSAEPEPSRVMVWLLRFLLFRLMFQSGCVKLLSEDETWWGLTALQFHYETQPLPTWVGWWAHQLPAWFLSTSVLVMFVIELAVPFLIFLARRARFQAFVWLAGLQVLIALTGNYCFFNCLTLALCLVLLDDAALRRVCEGVRNVFQAALRFTRRTMRKPQPEKDSQPRRRPTIQTCAIAVFASFVVLVGCTQLVEKFLRRPVGGPLRVLERLALASNTVNTYGLFAVMTTTRLEIVIEGSNDGVTWLEYEFPYKPGELARRPPFVAPHQPRLDWQMWFAALGDYRQNWWLIDFMQRVLQGSPAVLNLLAHDPFPNAPPRYLRAVVYDYHFTDRATRKETGNWWRREFIGSYCPVLTLR
jgi:predicted DCC family thiol-disulfide oxidoreductase YuxK